MRGAAHKETKLFIEALQSAGLVVSPKSGTRTGYVVRTQNGRLVGSFGSRVHVTTRRNIIHQARHCGVKVDAKAVRL